MNKLFCKSINNSIIIGIFIFIAIIVRIIFFVGHIFSDDAYYFKLSELILKNESLSLYQGYPIFRLRLLFTLANTLIMKIFGIKEISTILMPFLFSLLNLFLVYYFSKTLFNNNKVSLITMFLVVFFPVDIVFASISFPDSINVFFINLGLFFLYNAIKQNKLEYSIISGILFSLSLLLKENIFYYLIIISIIFLIFIIKKEKGSKLIFIPLLIVLLFFLLEGFFYKLSMDNFFYRFTILAENYKYSYYDFFPYSIEKLTHLDNYFYNLAYQIFLNFKYIFLRRFYLFLPLAALIISIINIFKKENLVVSNFFLFLSLLLIGFTTDLRFYRPLNLERSWYIFPLILPTVLVVAVFLGKLKLKFILLLLVIYVGGSLIMSTAYMKYFKTEENLKMKNYLVNNKAQKIYTDHFTKYSVDLITMNDSIAISITNDPFNEKLIKKESLLIYNKKHIDELNLQGYKFPGLLKILNNNSIWINSIGDFNIYQIKN